MDLEAMIIDRIRNMSGKYNLYQIFSDWVAMTAISIQNSCVLIKDSIWKEREAHYMSIAAKYSSKELADFCAMTGALTMILEEQFGDILGSIFMKAGCGSKMTGQFFTPYHLSLLTARLAHENWLISEKGIIEVNEPSTGGGGMMIAYAQILKEHGIDYQKRLHIVAQDLDWNGVYMTYIQLSLLGIKAVVKQGDTLRDPNHKDEKRILRTPAEMGALL